MRLGDTLKTPPSDFIKKLKDKNNKEFYSFFHNVTKKKEGTENEYEVVERYVVFVMNICVEPSSEIVIDKIIETKPKLNLGKDGREFLNNLVWIEATCKSKPTKEEGYTVHEDTPLPF